MRLAIITSGFLPVPATKGGAVENLIDNFLMMNDEYKDYNITVFSIYDQHAIQEAKKFNNTEVIFIKSNSLVDIMDKTIFFIAKNVLKKKNSHSYRFICRRLHYLNQVSKYLKKNNYDKVLLENHPTQYLALKWRGNDKRYEGKYYYHCHNEFAGTYRCKDIINQTKKFICVSEYISNSLQRYLGIHENQFSVLRNGIDEKKFNTPITVEESKKLRKQYGITENEKILLFAGRIVEEKGVKELIHSLEKVKREDYKLLIVGSALFDTKTKTNYELEVEGLINKLKDKIVFTGFIKYDDIFKLYYLADIAVLPSIWDDPAPLTIIEALTCGLPIITTVSGGIPEYAIEGSACFVNRDSNLIDNLACKIDLLLSDEKIRSEMSKNALKAAQNLTIEHYYQNFIHILNETSSIK